VVWWDRDSTIIDFQISARHKTDHDVSVIELYLPSLSVLMCYDGSDVDMKMMDVANDESKEDTD